MEKFIKWSCFITSGCVVIVFIFAVYIGTLLPDTFQMCIRDSTTPSPRPVITMQPMYSLSPGCFAAGRLSPVSMASLHDTCTPVRCV